MNTDSFDANGIVDALRQATDSESLWQTVQPFLSLTSEPAVQNALLRGLEDFIQREVNSGDLSELLATLNTMPGSSDGFAAEVQAVILRALFVSPEPSSVGMYQTLRDVLPELEQPITDDLVPLCDALYEYIRDGVRPVMYKALARFSKSNAAFTRVVLNEQRRGRRPSEEAFERANDHVAFLTRVDMVHKGILDAIKAAARVKYDVAALAPAPAPAPTSLPVSSPTNMPPQVSQSAESRVAISPSAITFDDLDDADKTLEDEIREAVMDARELPVGQRRTVLLDLARQHPDSIWPYVELSGIMPRAKDNLEMAERGLHNAVRFEDREFVDAHRGRFWEMKETQPYMRLLLHKARGLMDVRRLDAAIDVLEKALDL
jgi:hypothetical protein